MRNEITLKKYDVDYSFIVRNYLSPELWKKTWTLFVYKNVSITLNLYSIDVEDPITITFRIAIKTPGYSSSTLKFYSVSTSNLKVLKKQINYGIIGLITGYETNEIKSTNEYKELFNASIIEEERLRDIAENYLDDNGIYIDDVRDAYIDYYVSKNNDGGEHLSNYTQSMKYKKCPDLWLVYAKASDNEDLENDIKDTLTNNDYCNVLKEIKEYVDTLSDEDSDKYNDYFEEKESNLESIG